jgi:hypothetical protein
MGCEELKLCRRDKEAALRALKSGSIDNVTVSFPHLIDDIISEMLSMGLISNLEKVFEDKRMGNAKIPLPALLTLCIAAKMKMKNSMTDVPYAITDADLLSKLNWNIVDDDGLEKGLMSEGAVRNFVSKYKADELISYYNDYVQKFVHKELELLPNVHILDCSKLEVPLENNNYEESGVLKVRDKEVTRGYKLATLRGISGDYGIIEEIELGRINTHDLELSKDMLLNNEALKEGDSLIQDRGFISREMVNLLKNTRKVDVYMPIRKNMVIYEQAVKIAREQDNWQSHPNKKRKDQEVQLVCELGGFWSHDEYDVPLNACVVRDTSDPDKEEYYVFTTTDTSKSAKSIIKTYELRPEIEEDYRQLKDFWNLDNFQSTKHNFVAFHMVMVLIGYLFFQLYKETEEGSKFYGKSLPVVLKNYVVSKPKNIIVYIKDCFGIFSFVEFIEIYANCPNDIRLQLQSVIALM